MSPTWQQLPPLNSSDFDVVRRLAFDTCGISLHAGKSALVSCRLERLVRKYNFGCYGDYIRFLVSRRTGPEFSEFIDHLTTNHSGFWREPEHFLFLQHNVLPGKQKGVKIWSSACATGEEPYTIAMCCQDAGVPFAITATDISRTALDAAVNGEFEEGRLDALPAGWRDRFFEVAGRNSDKWRVTRKIRSGVRFGTFNLLHPCTDAGSFDVIFCRNVMIYFEQSTRDLLVGRLVQQLVPGGYLFTGHSETLLRVPPGLTYVQPATYRKC